MNEIEFLKNIICGIVNYPDEVEIDKKIDEMGVLLTVKVRQEDMGIVIGKAGTTAKMIRELLSMFGYKTKARISMKVLEPEGGTREDKRDHKPFPFDKG